ncbi:MAG: hypothetical protein ACK5M7_09280 [Draconibacterium sp.]
MRRIVNAIFVSLLFVLQTYGQVFKAGAAVRDITPGHLIPISGGMGEPVMPGAYQGKLTVRALVLEKGETKVAIVGIDNIGWPAYLGDRSRTLIKDIAPENVLIGVTHTHSAPDAYGFPDENGNTGADLDYLNWCVTQIADAVNEAANNVQPTELKTAVAEAKGKIAYNYYAPRLYDPRMGVIQVHTTSGTNKGKTIATLVNYATHPEILGTKQKLMSPDLCGPLYERIESKTGGIAIFMNSAQGGMVTADTRLENGGEANDWNECIRIGSLMADEALRIIAPAPVQQDPQLYCAAKMIELPVENEAMQFVFKHSPVAKQAEKQTDDFSKVTTQVNLLNIDTAQVLTIPGEALPNIGFYIKRHMKTNQPFLFGLTNDAFGYMLTKEDFNSFERYNYVSRTSLGEMTAEIYEQTALKFIEESPAADK